MGEYNTDRSWSDKYIPAMKEIIGPRILEISSFEVDTKNASDLIVFSAKNLLIACRVRRPKFIDYWGEFTIRAKRDSGAITELSKIVNGWADIMFYGYASNNGISIKAWHLIDLNAFRAHLIRDKQTIVMGDKANGDGTYFKWFKIDSFIGDPNLVIDYKKH